MRDRIIKLCPGCGALLSEEDIRSNPAVQPVGIQTVSGAEWMGGLMFIHDWPTCMTSFIVPFHMLEDLMPPPSGHFPIPDDTGCDHRCESVYNTEPCNRECALSRYHRLMMDLMKRREAARVGFDLGDTDSASES